MRENGDRAVRPDETEVRWLDEHESEAWMSLAGLVIRLPQMLEAQLQRDADLTFFEYSVLAALSEAPKRTLRMSRLAGLTNGSLSRLSHVVKRMEKRGFVFRELDPDDGRYTNALLTDQGCAKVVEAAPGHVAAVRTLVIDALERKQLADLKDIGDRVMKRVVPEGPFLP
jgi:DNA-binding MarR family transcriptional regulator